MRAIVSAHLTYPDVITFQIFGEECKWWTSSLCKRAEYLRYISCVL